MAVRKKLTEKERKQREKEKIQREKAALELKKERDMEARNRKHLRGLSNEELVKLYLQELEEYYPDMKRSRCYKDYDKEIERRDGYALGLMKLSKLKLACNTTYNKELAETVDLESVKSVQSSLFKLKAEQAKLLIYAYPFMQDLKKNKFPELEVDEVKYSKAIAKSNDLEQNMNWIQDYKENKANINVLLKSEDPYSLSFLVRFVKLTKEQLDYCIDTVIKSQDAESIMYTSYSEVIDKTTYEKLRKAIVATRNLDANEEFLKNKGLKLNKTQIKQHKNIIFESEDNNKYNHLVLPLLNNPNYFTEEEKDEIINGVIKSKNFNSAANLIDGCNNLTDKQLDKLAKIVLKNKSSEFFAKIIARVEAKNNKNKNTIVDQFKNKQNDLKNKEEQRELKFIEEIEEKERQNLL